MSNPLWETLVKANLIVGDVPKDNEIGSPWYIKTLLAFSGWLAAIFILGFFGAMFSRFYSSVPLLLSIGAALIVIANYILQTKNHEFLEHLALAISLAGQMLLLIAIDRLKIGNNIAYMWFIFASIQIFLAIMMPNFVHRVFSTLIAATCLANAFYLHQEGIVGPYIYSFFLILLTAYIWLNEFHFAKHVEKLQAIGYGLILALIAIKSSHLFMRSNLLGINGNKQPLNSWFHPWMGELLLSVAALFIVWKLLKRSQVEPSRMALILSLSGTLILSALSTQAEGLIIGIMIILLGFSVSNRVLVGLGILSLLFFISSYYYFLEITLLNKSITLLTLGMVLITGRWFMLRLLHNSKQEN